LGPAGYRELDVPVGRPVPHRIVSRSPSGHHEFTWCDSRTLTAGCQGSFEQNFLSCCFVG
jgi:hypothetical protein